MSRPDALPDLLPLLDHHPALQDFLGDVVASDGRRVSLTLPLGPRPAVLALAGARLRDSPRPGSSADGHEGGTPVLVAITATTREAEDLATSIASFSDPELVAVFPSWETLPHERMSPSADIVGRRMSVLRRLRHPGDLPGTGSPTVVVCPVRSLLQPMVAGLADLDPVEIRPGVDYDPSTLARDLVRIGYQRTDLVERRGQFAVRGGIVDVFPPTAEHPARAEFWGDTVEELRWFAVSDQRSLGTIDTGIAVPPCRELPLTDEVRRRAQDLLVDHPELTDILDAIANGQAVDGMEAISPMLVSRLEVLTDVLPAGSAVVVSDPDRVAARAEELLRTSAEFLEASWHNVAMVEAVGADTGRAPVDLAAAAYRPFDEVRRATVGDGFVWGELSPFEEVETVVGGGDAGDDQDGAPQAPIAHAAPSFRGDMDAAIRLLAQRCSDGAISVLVGGGAGVVKRLGETLRDAGVPIAVWRAGTTPPPGAVCMATATLATGFRLSEPDLLVLTDSDLFGEPAGGARGVRMPSRRKRTIDPLSLRAGDHVVHERHGVGRFVDMVSRTVAGTTREYMLLEYAATRRGHPPDQLFVPTDQLDLVSRYVGGEAPALSKMGGADWEKAKGRARKAVRQIAGELIRLYAARQNAPGHPFGPDTPWQAELEDSFAFVETPDQLACIEEVKGDMEKPVPMDRLICGDVGYGKTEIAVRAAFKAIQDGKQVAVLVPTTLLVQQHEKTFRQRYAAFPVKMAALSRFTPAPAERAALEGITDGSIDLVIGTHALLSSKVRFKRLGLVIIDEEQRFGVEHKEHLKAMRANVDVLTMSATPIPRTLEMAVTGIREMSTIATPPEERLPVLTYVGPHSDKQVAAAIRRELMREGQVFYLHNRVSSIDRVAAKIRELVPEAAVATAHGQMGEHRLENVIQDFWEKRIDVLVCTTIVESGIDIPNANTLIVDRADAFGLSQLHQLRGRVGRSRERAYAYFMYPAEKPMTQTAHDRLATIAGNTDLGSGIQVALKDLEIRGAGNLLGGEQSGHIADVGFDLYIRMVGEALAEFKGEKVEAAAELNIQIPVDAHLPESYVDGDRLRLEAYRRLAEAHTDSDLAEAVSEIVDRYGPMPEEVGNLVEVARFRMLAASAGLDEVVQAGQRLRLHPVELPDSRVMRLNRLHKGALYKPATRQLLVPIPSTATIGGTPIKGGQFLQWATDLINAILLDRPS